MKTIPSRFPGMAVVVASLAAFTPAARAQFTTAANPYLKPTWSSPYFSEPVLSVGDAVPRTSDPSQRYQMVGIPDGLGAVRKGHGVSLFMNHEFGNLALSEPIVGQPRIRGAFVSKWELTRDALVRSGDLAFTTAYQDGTFVGPIATTDNTTPAFNRFCSSYLATAREHGFDRDIYFAAEEGQLSFGPSFSPKGSQLVAIFDGEAHALSSMGFFAKENGIVMPIRVGAYTDKTVVVLTEDGPSTSPYSGVYLYVGDKKRNSQNPLKRNGLVGGKLYVLKSKNPARNSEIDYTQVGSPVACEWVEIPDASTLDENQLKQFVVANDFFEFSRPEDGAFARTPAHPASHSALRRQPDFFFVTTGEGPANGNVRGRLYRLALNPRNPAGDAELLLFYDANTATFDGPLAPDNIDVSQRYLFVCEDGTSSTRPEMNNRNRDGSVWRFDLRDLDAEPERIAELTSIGRDNILAARGTAIPNGYQITQRGTWESSGIIDTSSVFGPDTLLVDVQAHPPTTAPGVNTGEDGQLLLLLPAVQRPPFFPVGRGRDDRD